MPLSLALGLATLVLPLCAVALEAPHHHLVYDKAASADLNDALHAQLNIQQDAEGVEPIQIDEWSCATSIEGTNCSEHGTCQNLNCYCHSGWSGEDCSIEATCPNNCTEHGSCSAGVCVCESAWGGQDCSVELCPGGCNGHGICLGSQCRCDPGWSGETCNLEVACPNDCTCDYNLAGEKENCHGACEDGVCDCLSGWGAADCSIEINLCPDNCNDHGLCDSSEDPAKCECYPGWEGTTCGNAMRCPNDCVEMSTMIKRGVCTLGECVCFPDYAGEDCSIALKCSNDCSSNGQCILGVDEDGQPAPACNCKAAWGGLACDQPLCIDGCNSNGACVDGVCKCYAGFKGETCEQRIECPANCNDPHGYCHNGECACRRGWRGPMCSIPIACPSNCTSPDHGICHWGKCFCHPPYEGDDCSELSDCPESCSGKGICYNEPENVVVMSDTGAQCLCPDAYNGSACENKIWCPFDCSGNGICEDAECLCRVGFSGEYCQIHVPCPNNCTGPSHGHCVDDVCICNQTVNNSWTGADCSQRFRCPGDCSGHGNCTGRICECDMGYGGVDCSIRSGCLNPCNHGVCIGERCICDLGFTGDDCMTRAPACEPDECGENGMCYGGQFCVCDENWFGDKCEEEMVCPNQCSNHGDCIWGVCVCDAGWGGAANDCANETDPDYRPPPKPKVLLAPSANAPDWYRAFLELSTTVYSTVRSARADTAAQAHAVATELAAQVLLEDVPRRQVSLWGGA